MNIKKSYRENQSNAFTVARYELNKIFWSNTDINCSRNNFIFFPTPSNKSLNHVHLVELYLLLPLFAIDGNFT